MHHPRLHRPGVTPTVTPVEVQVPPQPRHPQSLGASTLFLDDMAGRPHRGSHDFNMRSTSAEIIAQGFQNIGFGRLRRPHQQRLCTHDHAVKTAATLGCLLANESFLYRVGMVKSAKPLKRQNLATYTAVDRDDARARSTVFDQPAPSP